MNKARVASGVGTACRVARAACTRGKRLTHKRHKHMQGGRRRLAPQHVHERLRAFTGMQPAVQNTPLPKRRHKPNRCCVG
eukprot:115804-Chlamydomonas_euryale.AAC.2